MLAAIAGVAVAVIGGGGIGEVSALGLVLAFLTMATFAVMLVLGPKQPSGVGPFARAGAPLLVASLIWIPIAPLWQLPFDRLGETAAIAGRFPLEVPLWAVLAWILLLGSTIPFVFELAGAARIGAGASSMVSFVEPIAGSILAWVVLAQALTAVQVAGLVGTIAAVAVVEHARLRSIRVVELPDALSPLAEADPR
jgi:drug/metabolite transporter (DMT)-like permease